MKMVYSWDHWDVRVLGVRTVDTGTKRHHEGVSRVAADVGQRRTLRVSRATVERECHCSQHFKGVGSEASGQAQHSRQSRFFQSSALESAKIHSTPLILKSIHTEFTVEA